MTMGNRASQDRRQSPPSFDKHSVRDYLETVGWNKTPPAPSLPVEIIEKTAQKYHETLERLIGAESP